MSTTVRGGSPAQAGSRLARRTPWVCTVRGASPSRRHPARGRRVPSLHRHASRPGMQPLAATSSATRLPVFCFAPSIDPCAALDRPVATPRTQPEWSRSSLGRSPLRELSCTSVFSSRDSIASHLLQSAQSCTSLKQVDTSGMLGNDAHSGSKRDTKVCGVCDSESPSRVCPCLALLPCTLACRSESQYQSCVWPSNASSLSSTDRVSDAVPRPATDADRGTRKLRVRGLSSSDCGRHF